MAEITVQTKRGHTRRDIFCFLGLAFVWSWLFWAPTVFLLQQREYVATGGGRTSGIPMWATLGALIGGYGPSIAALINAARAGGATAATRLVRELIRFRAALRWHAVAWLAPSAFMLLAIASYQIVGPALPPPTLDRVTRVLPVLVFALIFGPLGEELGWRGYLLPRLQSSLSPLKSSLLLGVIWTFWHLPLFWAPAGTLISGQPITLAAVGQYLLATTALAIFFTWLFNSSRGNLFLCVVLHTTFNAHVLFLAFPPLTSEVARSLVEFTFLWLGVAALIIIAVYRTRLSAYAPVSRPAA